MKLRTACIASVILASCLAIASLRAEAIPAERLYPDTTQGFVSIPSVEAFIKAWRETQIGKLMYDPVMAEFVKDARRQFKERLLDRFGFSLVGIEDVGPGELAVGMVTPAGQRPGFVVTLDVTGRLKETRTYLDSVGKQLAEQGAKKTTEKIGGDEITIFTFPPDEKDQQAGVPPRHAAYMVYRDTLILTDQKPLLLLFHSRISSGQPTASLADVASYQATMQRCATDTPAGAAVHLKWFVSPLAYGEAVRTLLIHRLSERRQKHQSIFSVLSEIGFDSLKGVGGTVSFKTENREVVYRIAVDAPQPHRGAMNAIALPNSSEWVVPNWMPRDLARCTLVNVDPVKIFDNIGPIFDGIVVQEKGVWDDVLRGLKEDANGPQIDVRSEIVSHLGTRVASMSRYEQPISPQSESIVIIIGLKPSTGPLMAKSLDKLFSNDPQVQQSRYKDSVIWQNNVEVDDIAPPTVGGSLPPLVSSPTTTSPSRPKPKDEDEQPATVFPQGGVTVVGDNLVIGTNVEYMQQIMDRLTTAPDSISSAADYRMVAMVMNDWGVANKPHCYQAFIRTDEAIRPTYELIRQGKMPQSETLLGKFSNAILATPDSPRGTYRRQQIDGSKMPEFDFVRRHFGAAGAYGVTEESGWFIKGCLLEK
ncbi:MAG: hypothetical protein ACRC46_08000 [Thermoguttaceae bacterium]